jgi:hypothetical protein
MPGEREERQEQGQERTLLLWQEKLVALAQERNTLLLESLSELRHIHKGVDALVAALPQPLSQLKSVRLIFGEPQIKGEIHAT